MFQHTFEGLHQEAPNIRMPVRAAFEASIIIRQ